MEMNPNAVIPKIIPKEDKKQSGSGDGSDPAAAAPSTDDAFVTKRDWMIPLQFQSDISHFSPGDRIRENWILDLTFWGRCKESMFDAFSHSPFIRKLTGSFRFAEILFLFKSD